MYITTPVYYVNASPHIGHAYTEIACDAASRFFRLSGVDTYFLTGTDEHGEKIEEATLKAGYKKGEEKKFVDSIVPRFKELWNTLGIKFDSFIRTTDPAHEKTVQKVLDLMKEAGDIYKGKYEGWFCTPCESFWTDTQVENGICPDCQRNVERIEEANYFFKLSKYHKWLISYINDNKDFIKPGYRRNEVLSFLKNDLQDLCISRPKARMAWGVELPFDRDYVTYVWFDALINYISGVGFMEKSEKFKKFWPADFHVIGKDIIRHHAVYWPIMLRSIGARMPKTVFAHGWWTLKGEKISKSKGNIVDPNTLVKDYGADAFRYFLLREVTFGLDGTFSEDSFITRFNSDLANDLGNLVNRTLTMAIKYFNSKAPLAEADAGDEKLSELNRGLKEKALKAQGTVREKMEELDFSGALTVIWEIVGKANKYIEDAKPWEYSKQKNEKALRSLISHLLESLRVIAVLVAPFMPEGAASIWKQLGFNKDIDNADFERANSWGVMKPGQEIQKSAPLFPRIIIK